MERLACEGDDFIPPKIMVCSKVHPQQIHIKILNTHHFDLLCCFIFQLISSKVPKAEYVPTIIRRDDPSIIPILYVSRLCFSLCITKYDMTQHADTLYYGFHISFYISHSLSYVFCIQAVQHWTVFHCRKQLILSTLCLVNRFMSFLIRIYF